MFCNVWVRVIAGRRGHDSIKVSWLHVPTRAFKFSHMQPLLTLFFPPVLSKTGAEHILNGSAGNNPSQIIIQSSQRHSLLRDEEACSALLTRALGLAKLKWDSLFPKRQSRQVSFINHDPIRSKAEPQSERSALYRLLSGAKQGLSWLFTKGDYRRQRR